MKISLLFLTLFLLPAYFFGSEEALHLRTNQAISLAIALPIIVLLS